MCSIVFKQPNKSIGFIRLWPSPTDTHVARALSACDGVPPVLITTARNDDLRAATRQALDTTPSTFRPRVVIPNRGAPRERRDRSVCTTPRTDGRRSGTLLESSSSWTAVRARGTRRSSKESRRAEQAIRTTTSVHVGRRRSFARRTRLRVARCERGKRFRAVRDASGFGGAGKRRQYIVVLDYVCPRVFICRHRCRVRAPTGRHGVQNQSEKRKRHGSLGSVGSVRRE